jgi:hypothetical protein
VELIVNMDNEICGVAVFKNRAREIYENQVLWDLKEFGMDQKRFS